MLLKPWPLGAYISRCWGAVEVSHSASVKKEEDGKWKVDTSYIGYRTIDPGNLMRKEEKQDDVLYAPGISNLKTSRPLM